MVSWMKVAWTLAILAVAGPAVRWADATAADDGQGTMTIIFTDGRQQTIKLASVARIEFKSATASASSTGRARFLGRWKLGDGTGKTFIATLKPDGVARKDRGNEKGTWTVMGGEALIKWDDGWLDVIRKVGGKYKKVAFAPGSTDKDNPHNIAEAEYLESN
jgi:hypothetical protein